MQSRSDAVRRGYVYFVSRKIEDLLARAVFKLRVGTESATNANSHSLTVASTRPATRSVQLDIVRAWAIFLVIGRHAGVEKILGVPNAMSQFWFRWGYFGVPLFFTLSGYLVGGLLISEFVRYGKIDVGRFLIRRSLKIYPPYFLFLVYIVMAPTLKGTVPLRDMLSDYWENFVFLQNYIGPDLAGHTWSLAVEEHFYLLLPFLLLACVRFGCMAWIVPLCLLSPLGGTAVRIISASIGDPYIHNFPNTMAATHLCVDGLLVGVGIRALNEFRPDAFNRLKVWRWVLLFTGTAILATSALSMPKFLGVDLVDRILPISTVAATAFLVAMLHMRPAGWIADATAWVGKYSYGIYLWHVTILGFAKRIIVSRIPGGSHSAHWVAAAMILIVSSVLFGALMSRLVEWPVLALRERVFPSRCASLPSRM